MKTETKLKKIMLLEDSNLKLMKLGNLALKTFPNSNIQKQILREYQNLKNKGFKELIF